MKRFIVAACMSASLSVYADTELIAQDDASIGPDRDVEWEEIANDLSALLATDATEAEVDALGEQIVLGSQVKYVGRIVSVDSGVIYRITGLTYYPDENRLAYFVKYEGEATALSVPDQVTLKLCALPIPRAIADSTQYDISYEFSNTNGDRLTEVNSSTCQLILAGGTIQ